MKCQHNLETLVTLLLNYHATQNYQSLLNQATQNMPKGAVADAGQLTSIGAAMGAKHNHVPHYVGGQQYQVNKKSEEGEWVSVINKPSKVNFSRDNATVLQIGLSLKYPFISDNDLNRWVENHMKNLHNSPVGFVDNKQFDSQLSQMNQDALKRLGQLR